MIALTLKPLPRQKTPPTKTPAAAAKPVPAPIRKVITPPRMQPSPPVKVKLPQYSIEGKTTIIPGVGTLQGIAPTAENAKKLQDLAAAHATPDAARSPAVPPPAIPKSPVGHQLNPADLPIAARLFVPAAASSPTEDTYSAKPAAPAPSPAVAPPVQARRLTPLAQTIAAATALKNQIPVETRQIYNPLIARSLPGAIPVQGVLRTAALPNPANINLARSITGTIGGIDINLQGDETPAATSGGDNTGKMVLIAAVVLAAAMLLLKRRR